MKTINQLLFLFAFLFVIIMTPSCGGNEKAESDEVAIEIAEENLITADYSVEGMVCAMGCAATIQKELMGVDGVADCEVDFDSGKAHVEFDKSKLSEDDIISTIESLSDGQYKVGEWTEKIDAEETAPKESSNEDLGNDNKEESTVEVSLPSFEIPNLLTLLIDQI
jgi:copper chaperone CopZ